MSQQPTPPVGKGLPGVNGRVVALWVGLIVAIAALVVVTDRVAKRDKSPKPAASQAATGTAPASATGR